MAATLSAQVQTRQKCELQELKYKQDKSVAGTDLEQCHVNSKRAIWLSSEVALPIHHPH